MRILCATDFKHGTDHYRAGEVRIVEDELGAYFCANGWASVEGSIGPGSVSTAEVTLDVHNAKLGVEDSNHG